MDNDLISRSALKKALELTDYNDSYDLTKTEQLIDNAPTVEPDRPQGEWSFNPYDSCSYCSVCQVKAPFGYKNFCPNCGADMKGGAE